MARRGRKPTPDNLRILKGLPGRGAAPLVPGRPEPPAYLDAIALAEWGRILPRLEARGVLTEDNAPSLGIYCAAFSRWREAEDLIRDDGLTVATARGGRQPHPAVRISRDATATMLKILGEFGTTPASRRGVLAAPPAEPDELAEFLADAGRA
jgi:P27 family predicted phage terminase small subunit